MKTVGITISDSILIFNRKKKQLFFLFVNVVVYSHDTHYYNSKYRTEMSGWYVYW